MRGSLAHPPGTQKHFFLAPRPDEREVKTVPPTRLSKVENRQNVLTVALSDSDHFVLRGAGQGRSEFDPMPCLSVMVRFRVGCPGAAQDTNSKNLNPAKRPTGTRVDFPGLPRTRSGSPFGKLTQKIGKFSKINCALTRPRIAEISTLKCSWQRPLCCSDAPLANSGRKCKKNRFFFFRLKRPLVRGRPGQNASRLGERLPQTKKLGKILKISHVLTRPRIAEISTPKCSPARPLCCSDAPLANSGRKCEKNQKCLVRGRPRTRHSPRLGEQPPADFRQKKTSVSWLRAGHHTLRD